MAANIEKKPILLLAINYRDRSNNPPSGLKWQKVKAGDTLGNIATRYGLTWMDLCLINFRTLEPSYINWYLRHFVGCRNNNGKWYYFTGTEKPGRLLVPDMPEGGIIDTQSSTPKIVRAVRGGRVVADSGVGIEVFEKTRPGLWQPISGKWLYVFSAPGLDFGSGPPALSIQQNSDIETKKAQKGTDEIPAFVPWGKDGKADASKPGSGFTDRFPGLSFNPTSGPDRLDYEIYVTPEQPPSKDHIELVGGHKVCSALGGPERYKRSWYFLSDQHILRKALAKSRNTRTQHVFRNTRLIKLPRDGGTRRYFFLLSRVQLGPNALKFAMAHPKSLTPLLDGQFQNVIWDTQKGKPTSNVWRGPDFKKCKQKLMRIGVADPYAWAESIAEDIYGDSVKDYAKWVTTERDHTVKKLERSTKWTSEYFYVANILKAARDSYHDPDDIDSELHNAKQFHNNIKKWHNRLIKKNADYAARATQDIIELYLYLRSDAHKLIDTALIKDATNNKSEDWLDVAIGLKHYCDCLDTAKAVPAGQTMIRRLFDDKDGFLWRYCWQYMRNIGQPNTSFVLPETLIHAIRYFPWSVIQLYGIRDYVEKKPTIPAGLNADQYFKLKLKQLVAFYNSGKLAPATLTVRNSSKVVDFVSVGGSAVVGMLDLADKVSSYVVEETCLINRKSSRVKWLLGAVEEWMKKTETRHKWGARVSVSTSWGLKIFAAGVNGFNLVFTIRKAIYDYQNKVTTKDWVYNASGLTVAVVDILGEIAVAVKSSRMQSWFPQFVTTAGKADPSWSFIRFTQIPSIVGRVVGSFNVISMVVASALTTWSMLVGFFDAFGAGDWSAAIAYGVGVIGGLVMTTGAIILAYGFFTGGAACFGTGAGAPIGVILFAIGGLIAGVAGLIAWLTQDTSLETYAYNSHFGKRADTNPGKPWSVTAKTTSLWTIEQQRRAILNLLGRFELESKVVGKLDQAKKYQGEILMTFKPSLYRTGSTIEMEMYYDNGTGYSKVEFVPPKMKAASIKTSKILRYVGLKNIFVKNDGRTYQSIVISTIVNVDFSTGKKLLTRVSLRYPGEKCVVRCIKPLLEDGWIWDHFDGDETSEIFQ